MELAYSYISIVGCYECCETLVIQWIPFDLENWGIPEVKSTNHNLGNELCDFVLEDNMKII